MVTGAGGMLARALLRELVAQGFPVFAFIFSDAQLESAQQLREAANDRLFIRRCDILDEAALREFGIACKPNLVIHLAADTRVDALEADRETAFRVNEQGARNVARVAADAGARMVYLSSDYVFDGRSNRPWREDDPPAPLSVYGQSKLAGERAVAEVAEKHFIVRTSWLYGRGGRNFVDTIRDRAAKGETLRVVNDQRGGPTWTVDLSAAILRLTGNKAFGVYHVSNQGECSWYELAAEIVKRAGLPGRVEAASTEEVARPAPRPAYSVLDNGKFERATGMRLPHWSDALDRYLASVPA